MTHIKRITDVGMFGDQNRTLLTRIAEEIKAEAKNPKTKAIGNGGSSHRSTKTLCNGILFDSKVEARRYLELILLEKARIIESLELQPGYDLIVNEEKIGVYHADFRYVEKSDGLTIVEDVKSSWTRKNREFRRVKKLMMAIYQIEIIEVVYTRGQRKK